MTSRMKEYDALNALAARSNEDLLADSPSVVEGEPVLCAVCDGFVPTWGVKVCDCEYMAPCGTKPAPPPVSTGSRPQEAVPTEQAEPTVLAAFADFVSAIKHAPISWETGCCCCGSPVEGHGFGDGHSPVDEGSYFVSSAIKAAEEAIAKATPLPAEGCSRNEGARGWIEWRGGENPVPGQLVQVRWRDQSARFTPDAPLFSNEWQWGHHDMYCDIIAYRILPQTEEGS